MEQKLNCHSLTEFKQAAAQFASSLPKRAIVTLSGAMGSGKTEFVKAVTGYFGIQGVASPTYALHHEYENSKIHIDHLDLYRLENEDDLETTGFWDFFSNEQGLIFIEWPEKMNVHLLPKDWPLFKIEIEVIEDQRRIRIVT